MRGARFPVVEALQPLVVRGELAGAVTLIADQQEILQIDTVGCSDLASRTPMRADSLFWIASTTKPMTAVALMMLVDEGKVRVEVPIEQYLPEYAGQQVILEQTDARLVLGKPSRPITVHDVLNHTSGLPFMSRVEKVIDARPLREACVSYALTPLLFEPGTRYQYSNAGTNTVGRIVEAVSRQPYETFIQERLFNPLGMTETSLFLNAARLSRLAKTYRPSPDQSKLEEMPLGQFTHPLDGPGHYPCPAGGLFAVGKDVAAFGQMLLGRGVFKGRRILSEESFRRMTTSQTGSLLFTDGVENGYGYGFEVSANGEFGHGGAYSNKLWIDPAAGRAMVFMVQHGGWIGPQGNMAWPAFKATAAAP